MSIIEVTNEADSGSGSLRAAISSAVSGDTIIFDPVISTIILSSGEILINKNVTINGPSADKLTVSGDGKSRIFVINSSVEATISGISIINGFTMSSGGAIYNLGTINIMHSTLTNNHCFVNENPVGERGGGAILNLGIVNISDSIFFNNRVSQEFQCTRCEAYGGAILNKGGIVSITNSTLQYNNVSSDSDDKKGGGAITNHGGRVTIKKCMLLNNVSNFGGAILNDAVLTITESTLSYNSLDVIENSGTVTISDSTISYNKDDYNGTIYNSGTAIITGSTLSHNTVSGLSDSPNYSGIFRNDGTANITNSTISNNDGGFCWTIRNEGILNISFTTIAENQVDNEHAVIYTSSSISFKNSIVANNNGLNFLGSGSISVFGVNFDTDGTCPGFTKVEAGDIKLGSLALNPPGTTETHALLRQSIAIDAAAECTDLDENPVGTDQRGVSRPQGKACDAGAYEYLAMAKRGIALW